MHAHANWIVDVSLFNFVLNVALFGSESQAALVHAPLSPTPAQEPEGEGEAVQHDGELRYASTHQNDNGYGYATNNGTGRVYKLECTGSKMTLKGIIKIFATPSASRRVKVGFSLSMSDKAAEVYTNIVTRELTRVNDEQAREFMTALG